MTDILFQVVEGQPITFQVIEPAPIQITVVEEILAFSITEEILSFPQVVQPLNFATAPAESLHFTVQGGGYAEVVRYMAQTEDEKFWEMADFIKGTNIIGVRGPDESYVYLPHELPVERLVIVKDEAGTGTVTVRVY